MRKKLQQYLLSLIEKKNNGYSLNIFQGLILFLLAVLSLVYNIIVRVRNFLYDKKLLPIKRIETRVICVGNITAGGTGKTPLVEKIARHFAEFGQKPVVISRGYKAEADRPALVSNGEEILLGPRQAGDEAYMLAKKLPGIPVIIGRDRFKAGQLACRKFAPEIVILDDGFQHRRLHRDRDMVVLDCLHPFGYQYLLPRGLLREPLTAFGRAQNIILNGSQNISEKKVKNLQKEIKNYNRDMEIFCANYSARSLKHPLSLFEKGEDKKERNSRVANSNYKVPELKELKGRQVMAIAGIGNPPSFKKSLQKLGARVKQSWFFPDHYHYTAGDFEKIARKASEKGIKWLLVTEKDAVKLNKQLLAPVFEHDLEIYYLEIEMELSVDLYDLLY